jgi:hypothetical protein
MIGSVTLLDSVTKFTDAHRGAVLITGSHGGLFAAGEAARARARAAVFNDAGGGYEEAGVAGVMWLDRFSIPALAVSHLSAFIGDAQSTLNNGRISAANSSAQELGCHLGDELLSCIPMLQSAPTSDQHPQEELPSESRHVLRPGGDAGYEVVGIDSASLAQPDDADRILITGSHGAVLGHDPATALKTAARGAIFHDAGGGPGDRGKTRLPALDGRGIPAATVDSMSARIGDARSTWSRGVVSAVNTRALAFGVRSGMSVPQFADLIGSARPSSEDS